MVGNDGVSTNRMKKSNQLKLGSFLSYVQMGLGAIINLAYTPIMTSRLGQSEYGLYNTVSSTISMLSLLSLGFNSGYIRYYAKYKKENDRDSIFKLNGLFLMIFLMIGMVALGCGLFLSFHLDIVFDRGLTAAEYGTARILMILLTINLAVSFPMSVFSSIISAHERYVFLKLLGMLKTVASPLITLPLLLAGYRSVAMAAVTVGIALVTDTCYLFYVLVVLKNRFVFCGIEKGLFKDLFVYTIFIAVNLIVDQINWNIDKILLGRYKGTEVVAVYSVGYSLYSYYQMLSTSVSGVFTPRVHRIINDTKGNLAEQKRQLTELFVKVGRVQFLILGLAASGLIFFGKVFITNYWVGVEYGESYYVMILLVLAASIPLIQNLGIEIQRAQNNHQFRSILYLIMSALNLFISVILCQRYGAVGSAVGTAVSLVVANGLIMNIYYHKKCNIDIILFWKNMIRMSAGLVVPIVCGILINRFWNQEKFLSFLAAIVIYSTVYCVSMWLFGMNDYEKDIIRKPLERILKYEK